MNNLLLFPFLQIFVSRQRKEQLLSPCSGNWQRKEQLLSLCSGNWSYKSTAIFWVNLSHKVTLTFRCMFHIEHSYIYLSFENFIHAPRLKRLLLYLDVCFTLNTVISISLMKTLYMPQKVTFLFRCMLYIEHSYISLCNENSIHVAKGYISVYMYVLHWTQLYLSLSWILYTKGYFYV